MFPRPPRIDVGDFSPRTLTYSRQPAPQPRCRWPAEGGDSHLSVFRRWHRLAPLPRCPPRRPATAARPRAAAAAGVRRQVAGQACWRPAEVKRRWSCRGSASSRDARPGRSGPPQPAVRRPRSSPAAPAARRGRARTGGRRISMSVLPSVPSYNPHPARTPPPGVCARTCFERGAQGDGLRERLKDSSRSETSEMREMHCGLERRRPKRPEATQPPPSGPALRCRRRNETIYVWCVCV